MTLAKILSISVPSGVGANAFISMTGMEKLDNQINIAKKKAIEVLNFVLKYLFEAVPNSEKKKSPFLPKAIQFSNFLAFSLISVCQRPNIMRLLEDETLSELLVESIDTLVLFCGEQEF